MRYSRCGVDGKCKAIAQAALIAEGRTDISNSTTIKLIAVRKRQLASTQTLPPEFAHLEQISLHAAGIDVGAAEHWVCVFSERAEPNVRCFGCFTPDLMAMAEWLISCGVTTVAMESTRVYWIPVFQILESNGMEVKLANAHPLKTVPGRKSDVLDCQWLQKLHSYGLLAGSFRPDEQMCVLRSYVRQRERLIQGAALYIQRLQHALIQMNVQLHKVISDISGATGRRSFEPLWLKSVILAL